SAYGSRRRGSAESRPDAGRAASREEFQAAGSEADHAQQEPAMLPARDVGLAVGTGAITDGQVEDAQVEPSRTEEQIKIAEWIEVAEVSAVIRDQLVMPAQEYLGSAERVLNGLAQQPGEGHAEKFVADDIEEAHGLLFHGINEAHAIDDIR